jgi:hypothetical protein
MARTVHQQPRALLYEEIIMSTKPLANETLKNEMRQIADELQMLANEVRLKLHLAGMDARTNWAEFEPRLIDFGKRVERSAEHTAEEVRALACDLKSRLKEFHARVAH